MKVYFWANTGTPASAVTDSVELEMDEWEKMSEDARRELAFETLNVEWGYDEVDKTPHIAPDSAGKWKCPNCRTENTLSTHFKGLAYIECSSCQRQFVNDNVFRC